MIFGVFYLQYLKPKSIDYKPRRTKAKGKGGTAKVIKNKKILKDCNRKVGVNSLTYYMRALQILNIYGSRNLLTFCEKRRYDQIRRRETNRKGIMEY